MGLPWSVLLGDLVPGGRASATNRRGRPVLEGGSESQSAPETDHKIVIAVPVIGRLAHGARSARRVAMAEAEAPLRIAREREQARVVTHVLAVRATTRAIGSPPPPSSEAGRGAARGRGAPASAIGRPAPRGRSRPSAPASLPFTVAVEHDHFLGHCKGELVVLSDRLEFRSRDKRQGSRSWSDGALTSIRLEPGKVEVKAMQEGKKPSFDFKVKGRIPEDIRIARRARSAGQGPAAPRFRW